jgi:putative heme iron utilization protein
MHSLKERLESFQSTVLGTISDNGYPFSSYAPCVYDGEKIYIFISDIATHSKNIKRTQKASALFIEDEKESDNIFARKRISLQCDAHFIPREDRSFPSIMDAFKHQHEEGIVNMLMGNV